MEEAQRKLDAAMRHILSWLREHSLQLATQKSEIGEYPVVIIETKTSVKFLGLWLDNKLSSVEHIRQVCGDT